MKTRYKYKGLNKNLKSFLLSVCVSMVYFTSCLQLKNRPRFKDQDYKRKMLLYIEEDRIYVFNIHTYTYICNNVVYNNIFSSFYLYLFLFQFLQFKFSFYQVANELR